MPRRSARAVGDDVDPAVRVVDPVDRHLVDPQAGPLGQHQQFGVEEPAGVNCTSGSRWCATSASDRLEPALGVGEPGREGAAQQQVVAAGDGLPLEARGPPARRAPVGCRSRRPSGPTSAGRPAAAGRPGRWTGQRPCRPAPLRSDADQTSRSARPATLLRAQASHHGRPAAGLASSAGHGQRSVGARVVGDRDAERIRSWPCAGARAAGARSRRGRSPRCRPGSPRRATGDAGVGRRRGAGPGRGSRLVMAGVRHVAEVVEGHAARRSWR